MTVRPAISLLLVSAAVATAGAAPANIAERLHFYVLGCEAAVLRNEIDAFADLPLINDSEGDRHSGQVWQEGPLAVSLDIFRTATKPSALCEVTYLPPRPDKGEMAEIHLAMLGTEAELSTRTSYRRKPALRGSQYYWCVGPRPLSLTLFDVLKQQKFVARLAFASSEKLNCEG